MKRALSLILALVLCLGLCFSLCGCNSEAKKYAGTYEGSNRVRFYYWDTVGSPVPGMSIRHVKDIPVKDKLVLKKNGTGTLERCFADSITEAYYGDMVREHNLKVGQLHSTYDIKWTVEDGYIVIQFSGTTYFPEWEYTQATEYISSGESDSFSKTYELRANKLFDIESDGNTAQFTKE